MRSTIHRLHNAVYGLITIMYLLHHGDRVCGADASVKDSDEGGLEGCERLGVVRSL